MYRIYQRLLANMNVPRGLITLIVLSIAIAIIAYCLSGKLLPKKIVCMRRHVISNRKASHSKMSSFAYFKNNEFQKNTALLHNCGYTLRRNSFYVAAYMHYTTSLCSST